MTDKHKDKNKDKDKHEGEKDWVEVAETGNEEVASLIAGLLQSEGIPVEVEGSATHPWPETIPALGTNRVTVPPDRAAEAREILATREKLRTTERVDTEPGESDEE